MRELGPWKIIHSDQVYGDPWLTLTKNDVLRPDGDAGTYVVARLKAGVSVLAIENDEQVYLTEEFHYGVGRVTIEAASGGVEPGEDALESAKRELREEVGIEPSDWTDLGTVDPFTANVVSPTRLYLARGLSHVAQDLEGTEQIQIVKIELSEAIKMVLESTITHGPSCVLILKAALMIGQVQTAAID